MNRLLPVIILVLFSCNESKPKEVRSIKQIDSLLEIQKDNYVPPKAEFKDTIGISQAPVKVIHVKLIKNEYTNSRSISITYKNVSEKNIDGIKFHWLTDGTWGKEDIGLYSTISTDELFKKGQIHTREWDIKSKNKNKCMAWPTEVVFSDGSRWKLNP
jgi:hypothetical protein